MGQFTQGHWTWSGRNELLSQDWHQASYLCYYALWPPICFNALELVQILTGQDRPFWSAKAKGMGSLGKSKTWSFQQYNSSEKYKRVSQESCLQILLLHTSLPWLPSSACSLLPFLSQNLVLVLQLTILLGVFAYAVLKPFQAGTMSFLYTIDPQHEVSFLASNSWPT